MTKKKIYSSELGIDLEKGEKEIFKWFLACLLFGKPIQQEVARKTYFEFRKNHLLSCDKILKAGWDKLVKVLDEGHYVRYDFSTATKLLDVCQQLKKNYSDWSSFWLGIEDVRDLKKKLLEFKGVGPITVKIFLRDIQL